MITKTVKRMTLLQRFVIGLAFTLSISGFSIEASAVDEPTQPTDAAQTGETEKKEKEMLSITKAAPALTPVSDYSGDFLDRSTMTGDWRGSRTHLYENGITFDAALTQVYQGVVSGGKDSDSDYTGLLDYGITLDTGKLNWWPGGLLTFNAQTGFASGFPLEAGVVSPPNFTEIYPTANKPDTQLMEYYLTQAFSKEFSMILGRVNAVNFLDRNRFANDPREQFLNLSMDNDPLFGAFISFSTYGVLGHWQITDNISISPAIYDASTQPGNYFDNLFSDVGFAAEGEITWKVFKDLGGAFRVDGIYATKDATAFDNPRLFQEKIEGVPVKTYSGNWIVSLNAEQYLWKPSFFSKKSTVRTASFDFQEPGIGLFGRFSYAPEDRNAWNMYASGGIGARGIIPGRRYDRMGLGVYWLSESNDLDNQPVDLLDDEIGFEAFYNIALTPWAQLSFDFQWINSGITSIDNAIVLGTRLLTRF